MEHAPGRMIQIEKDYYEKQDYIYTKSYFVFYPGVNFLVGCNGSGKTTLMHHIEDLYSTSSLIAAKRFDCADTHTAMTNLLDGFSSNSKSVELGATMLLSSEGERITQALTECFRWFWTQVENQNIKEIWFMLDSFDSGLDIPTIIEIIQIFDSVLEKTHNKKVYILISANNYATIKGQSCIDVNTSKSIWFANFEEYANFCVNSKKFKHKRYDNLLKATGR